MTLPDYNNLFTKAQILPEHQLTIQRRTELLLDNEPIYAKVQEATETPWWVVACIHSLEASCNFTRHLHNGDPLIDRTWHVPADRPIAPPRSGHMPYEWWESAVDAINLKRRPKRWDLAGSLGFMERYNGLGYWKRGLMSPYLWSMTNLYSWGIFSRDGYYDAETRSENVGAAALLKALLDSGLTLG